MSERLIIYHASCWDGLTAAWVLARHLWPDAAVVPAKYRDSPPDVTGKDVIVVDFSYPRETLLEMHSKAKGLLVLDHHRTAQKDLEGLSFCTFDMARSGARLAWDAAMGDEEPPPLVVRYVEDRDLWKKQLINHEEIVAWIYSHGATQLEVVDHVHHQLVTDLKGVVAKGETILRVKDRNVADLCRPSHFVNLGGVRTLVVNNGLLSLTSDVGHELIEEPEAELAGCWVAWNDGTVRWSLRSVDRKRSAMEVAEKFGGGGHRNAAGFTLTWEQHCEVMRTAEWEERR